MRIPGLLAVMVIPVFADDCRVLVDGTGCRTRQLAITRIFEKVPGVKDAEVLPRAEAPAQNQRYFLIRTTGKAPSRELLVEALGRRAKHYHIISVDPEPTPVVNSGTGRS